MQQNYFLKAKKFAIFTEYEGPFSCSQDAATGLDFKNQIIYLGKSPNYEVYYYYYYYYLL